MIKRWICYISIRAGMSGFHKVRTLVRFVINQGAFQDLEVIELADK